MSNLEERFRKRFPDDGAFGEGNSHNYFRSDFLAFIEQERREEREEVLQKILVKWSDGCDEFEFGGFLRRLQSKGEKGEGE